MKGVLVAVDGTVKTLVDVVPTRKKGWVTYELTGDLAGVTCTFNNANKSAENNAAATKIYGKYYHGMLKIAFLWGNVYFQHSAGLDAEQLKTIKSSLK